MAVEEEFEVEIDDEDIKTKNNVGQLVDYIHKLHTDKK